MSEWSDWLGVSEDRLLAFRAEAQKRMLEDPNYLRDLLLGTNILVAVPAEAPDAPQRARA